MRGLYMTLPIELIESRGVPQTLNISRLLRWPSRRQLVTRESPQSKTAGLSEPGRCELNPDYSLESFL